MRSIVFKIIIGALGFLLTMPHGAAAQTKDYPKAKVSFDDYKNLVAEVEKYRAQHLIDLNTFLAMSKEPGTIILDARSDFRFDRLHLRGAQHLSFTDFTQKNLAKTIPSFQTKILIYCNNNFEGNQEDFASKIARQRPVTTLSIKTANLQGNQEEVASKSIPPKPLTELNTQMAEQAKPMMMALNIPTYINLFGYGYQNVFELDELVNVHDPRIAFDGTVAPQ